MLNDVSGSITGEVLGQMKLWLAAHNCQPAALGKYKTPEDVLLLMIDKNMLSYNQTEHLKDLFQCIEHIELLKVVESYEESCPERLSMELDASGNLAEIQRELMEWYQDTLSKLHPIPWCKWKEKDLNHLFTNLEIVEGRKHDLFKRNPNPVPKDDDLATLLWSASAKTRSFIEGPAGIGKSTLCRQLVYLWATEGKKIHGRYFDLVFILEARNLTQNLIDSIYSELFPRDSRGVDKDTVNQCLEENQEHNLLIIDGVDELRDDGEAIVKEILEGKRLRKINLILAGRPEAAHTHIQHIDRHLRIKGFTWDNTICYINKYFGSHCDKAQSLIRLLHVQSNRDVYQMALTPFTLVQLCFLVEENPNNIPNDPAEVLQDVVRVTLEKYTDKLNMDESEFDKLLSSAELLAFNGVKSQSVVFDECEIEANCIPSTGEHLLKSGLLNRDFMLSRRRVRHQCYYPHRSIQEFLCARFLAQLEPFQLKEICKENLRNPHLKTTEIIKDVLYLVKEKGEMLTEIILYTALTDVFSANSRQIEEIIFNQTDEDFNKAMADKMCRHPQVNACLTMYPFGTCTNMTLRFLRHMDLKHPVVVEDFFYKPTGYCQITLRCLPKLSGGWAQEYVLYYHNPKHPFPRYRHSNHQTSVFVIRCFHHSESNNALLRKLTQLHCVTSFNIKSVINLLEQGVTMTFLGICLFPGKVCLPDMKLLTDRLKSVKHRMVVYLVAFIHPDADFYKMKMLQCLYKSDIANVVLSYQFIHWVKRVQKRAFPKGIVFFKFNKSFHRQYFDKYSPY